MSRFYQLLIFMILSTLVTAQDFDVYVSDAGNFNNPPWRVVKYDQNGENPEQFITTQLGWPQDILFRENEKAVLISNLNTGVINKHNADSGEFISVFAGGIQGPTRMKIGPDGKLYVLQWQGTGTILKYDLDGTALGNFSSTGVQQSIGLDWDNDNNLYVSSYNGKFVQKFNPDGISQGKFISVNLSGPTNIWFGESGELYVLDYTAGNVKRFNSEGEFLGIFISNLSNPEGIDFLDNGDLLIGNGGTGSVKQFSSDGSFIKDFVSPGLGSLKTPNAVIIRKKKPTVTEEPQNTKAYIYPNEGNMFYVDSSLVNQVKSIYIYNSEGVLVKQLGASENMNWDASQVPAGIYMTQIQLINGPLVKEKLVVVQ